ncbi:hypothetical protein [Lysinibacillus sphaericus]|uniref:hypothetical protein n=1 Tax=Lysinibacillus sphaericus TaxID=1421 RepID=UPI00056CCE08|nr:hypothetical protein [Lysinibacillus sphaericus]
MHVNKENEMELTLSEDFYHELNTLTIDPKVDLEKLHYLSIVTGRNSNHAIFWFKEVYTRGQGFFARAEMLGEPVQSHDVAVNMMNILAERLQNAGVPIKR